MGEDVPLKGASDITNGLTNASVHVGLKDDYVIVSRETCLLIVHLLYLTISSSSRKQLFSALVNECSSCMELEFQIFSQHWDSSLLLFLEKIPIFQLFGQTSTLLSGHSFIYMKSFILYNIKNITFARLKKPISRLRLSFKNLANSAIKNFS